MPQKYSEVPAAAENPLLDEIHFVRAKVARLKEKTKRFYFHVLLSQYKCPKCRGPLKMTNQYLCSCLCGNTFDPTLTFQKSTCCAARLIRKTFHYACSRCNRTNPSRFIFDERIFDHKYFAKMMKASRAKSQKKKEQMVKFYKENRSGALPILEEPRLEDVPGLIEELDSFTGAWDTRSDELELELNSGFEMKDYRSHILSTLGHGDKMFSSINCISSDSRGDKIWRFVTLIFMQHDQEVELTQYDNDLLIEKMEG